MRYVSMFAAALAALATAATLPAQPPAPRPPMSPIGPMPMGAASAGPLANSAEFLLAHTGDLRLDDQQVVRLAAIARRAADRRLATRASLDSMRPNCGGGVDCDSTVRAQLRRTFDPQSPMLRRMREGVLADRRDAIAVLTPEQQATAWELVAADARMEAMRGGPGIQRRVTIRRAMPMGRPSMRRPPMEMPPRRPPE